MSEYIPLLITIIGWIFGFGIMYQKLNGIDKRLTRIENQQDRKHAQRN